MRLHPQTRRLWTAAGAAALLLGMANIAPADHLHFERTPTPRNPALEHPVCLADPPRRWADGTVVEVPCGTYPTPSAPSSEVPFGG